jgi:ParB family chromosome partitioning protein
MKDKKRAMGRGLGAILSSESKDIHSANDSGAEVLVGNIIEVSIEDIYPNPNQPRTHLGKRFDFEIFHHFFGTYRKN